NGNLQNLPPITHYRQKMDNEDLIKIFYSRLFPSKELCRWLGYGNGQLHDFPNREFSFTLANDAYLRFLSFSDDKEFTEDLKKFCPAKIDIGAVYNGKPKEKKGTKNFTPVTRELVFDIDMTDYDPIRTCCKEANICTKCWEFMTISIKVIDRALREDFGFKNRLWVYSGRRGVHCWVCDDRARKLTAEGRRAIVNYLEIARGGDDNLKKASMTRTNHRSVRQAYEVLDKSFKESILLNQDVLKTADGWNKSHSAYFLPETKTLLNTYWTSHADVSPLDKWEQLVTALRDAANKKPMKKQALMAAALEITFHYTYPRLDANVSVGLNHLLKSPFCVHPKTGRVCVPIDPLRCDDFDPFAVPTLQSLMDEINAHSDPKAPDAEKTSLKEYVSYFREFNDRLAEEWRQKGGMNTSW
ncbi:primase, DNA, polypeptide 1 (49kDa), partial [Irineochytrium annulatum]